MTPENGGRIELRLGQATIEQAEYEAHLQTPGMSWRTRARVGASAGPQQVDFGAWQAEPPSAPPDWLAEDARAALKAALRTSRAEGRWPRRITRWRPEPSA